MATILNINTAFETAHVFLSSNENIIVDDESNFQKEHASFLEPAIKKIIHSAQISLNSIDAVSVVNGPGSYTGLRVGLSSAKALCYALQKPLILLNTLDVMAYALKLQLPVKQENILFCPLIDARRMEVYTALYNYDLDVASDYTSTILDHNFLEKELKSHFVVAGGNGSFKLQEISGSKNILYINPLSLLKPVAFLANKAFTNKTFSNVIYSEPFYIKPVYFRKN